MSGFQIEHAPNCDHVVSQNWITKGGHFGCVLRQDATDVQISGYVMSNHVTSFSCQGPTGKVSNMKATNSGAPEIGSGMVDGGGNVWA
jgi:hypothetical protein